VGIFHEGDELARGKFLLAVAKTYLLVNPSMLMILLPTLNDIKLKSKTLE
jgi:hypothetical protein